MTKSVLFLSNSGSFFGGGEVSLFGLLCGLDSSRFRPVVVCPDQGALVSRLEERGIRVEVVPMPSIRGVKMLSFPSSLRKLRSLIDEHEIEIIHANSTRCMLYGGLPGKISGVPVIWHVRVTDTDPLLDRLLNRLSTRILVSSHSVLSRFSFLRQNRDRISVVHNGVDTRMFSPSVSGTKVRQEFSIDPDVRVVSVVGRLDQFKGHSYFLEAAREIVDRVDGVRFLIVGEGEIRSQLEEQCRGLGLNDAVVFCGEREDVASCLAASDVLVSASLKEGFGRAVVEGMAMAMPVVATRVGGVPEIIQDGETGLMVDPANPAALAAAVLRVVEDRELAARLAVQARKRAEAEFSLETHVRKIEEIYDSL